MAVSSGSRRTKSVARYRAAERATFTSTGAPANATRAVTADMRSVAAAIRGRCGQGARGTMRRSFIQFVPTVKRSAITVATADPVIP